MKKILVILAVGIFLTMAATSAYALHSHVGSTGLLYYVKEKAFPGYVAFKFTHGPNKTGAPVSTYVINLEGQVVNEWHDFQVARFLDNGNIFGFNTSEQTTGHRGEYLQEIDWDGNEVWKWKIPKERSDIDQMHHQFRAWIFNKKLNAYTHMTIIMKKLTLEEGLAGGADPSKMRSDARPDGIIEVDMDGNIIWEWWSWDHVVQDIEPTKANYVGKGKTIADHPGKLDVNWGRGMRGDFVHFNSVDYNETLGQVVVNNSVGSEFWIIDHQGTFIPGDYEASKALAASDVGDFVYRWGNPSLYGAGKGPSFEYGISSNGDQQCFFSHGIHWIPEGLPGAGNFLYFDNGQRRQGSTYSRILEINPYDGPMENGVYVPLMEAGFDSRHISNQIVWSYQSKHYSAFYSHQGSCAQRLPNGNTFVTTGRGQMFQVTPEGELVWEYVVPADDKGKVTDVLIDNQGLNPSFANMYGADHPVLAGKNLTPQGTITELAAQGKIIQPKFAGKGAKGSKGKKGSKK